MSSVNQLLSTENGNRIAYRLSYEISPIVLVGGIASQTQDGKIPIVNLTENNLNINIPIDNFFVHYEIIPGSTLIDQEVATYPCANIEIAANAVIAQGLHFSLKMICPARNISINARKTILTSLQQSLNNHISQGGSFNVVTPSYTYTDCLLIKMSDISNSESKQNQVEYQLDFYQPLITIAQALQSQNLMMSKISNGLPTDGSLLGNSGGGGNTQAENISAPVTPVVSSSLPPPSGQGGGAVPTASEGPVNSSFTITSTNVTSSSGNLNTLPKSEVSNNNTFNSQGFPTSINNTNNNIYTVNQANNTLPNQTTYSQVSYTSGNSIPNYTSSVVTNSRNPNFNNPIPVYQT